MLCFQLIKLLNPKSDNNNDILLICSIIYFLIIRSFVHTTPKYPTPQNTYDEALLALKYYSHHLIFPPNISLYLYAFYFFEKYKITTRHKQRDAPNIFMTINIIYSILWDFFWFVCAKHLYLQAYNACI